jgi:hypothetical protein
MSMPADSSIGICSPLPGARPAPPGTPRGRARSTWSASPPTTGCPPTGEDRVHPQRDERRVEPQPHQVRLVPDVDAVDVPVGGDLLAEHPRLAVRPDRHLEAAIALPGRECGDRGVTDAGRVGRGALDLRVERGGARARGGGVGEEEVGRPRPVRPVRAPPREDRRGVGAVADQRGANMADHEADRPALVPADRPEVAGEREHGLVVIDGPEVRVVGPGETARGRELVPDIGGVPGLVGLVLRQRGSPDRAAPVRHLRVFRQRVRGLQLDGPVLVAARPGGVPGDDVGFVG